jgi:deazaflavin-dependent oxidoreductase (nitroreductase family)
MNSEHPGAAARAAAGLLRTRWVVRAPIWLYKARLGFVLGHRFIMVEHTGRRSGRPRYVVLEVIDRPRPDRYVVASGFGNRSQWFRNVQVNPNVRLRVGGRAWAPAHARRLDPAEATEALDRYAKAHPRSWAALRPVLESALGARIDDKDTNLPLVDFDASGAR